MNIGFGFGDGYGFGFGDGYGFGFGDGYGDEGELIDMNEATKEKIIDRLHKSSSVCGHCKRPECSHTGYRELPHSLDVADVLEAINLGEFFFKETIEANG